MHVNRFTIDIAKSLFERKKKKFRKLKKLKVNFLPKDEKNMIMINTHFWKHLNHNKNNQKRSFKDVILRLYNIKNAITLLENTHHYQDKYSIITNSKKEDFIFIVSHINANRLGIVLRRSHSNRTYHLYSIIPNWKGYIPRQDLNLKKVAIHRP